MHTLLTAGKIGTLGLPNRFVRSATAERLAYGEGRPRPPLETMYRELAHGLGLLITGHMYVHPSGRAHEEMTGVYSDELIPGLGALAEAVHCEGGLIPAQINHGGMQCSRQSVSEAQAPSDVGPALQEGPAREMTPEESEMVIDAFAQAARRVKAAGFDAVQLHGAHGYLVSEFLSPLVNRRTDQRGGDLRGRSRFLRAVCREVREQVGPDYPVFIKLGMMDSAEGGLTPAEAVQVVASLKDMGLDAVEISGGLTSLSIRKGIRSEEGEAYFRPLARMARQSTDLPILLVGGIRSRRVMEGVLDSQDADFISLCRPLICEPDLPNRLKGGQAERSACISGNRCWPEEEDIGIACKCAAVRR